MKSVLSDAAASAPLLVLLPGLDGTGRLFRIFVECLPASVESVVVPLPNDAFADYESLARSISPRLPIGRPFFLLGESFSGPIALTLAARRDLNIRAVILVASFVRRPIAWLPNMVRRMMGAGMFRLPGQRLAVQHMLAGGAAPESFIEEVLRCLHSNDHQVLADRLRLALTADATQAFLRCPAPILYLRGDKDRLIGPNTARKLKRLRTDMECRTIRAPHFILQMAPSDAVDVVSDYMSSIGNGSSTRSVNEARL